MFVDIWTIQRIIFECYSNTEYHLIEAIACHGSGIMCVDVFVNVYVCGNIYSNSVY